MYKTHSCIRRVPNFGTEFQGKKVISCISRTPTLEDRRQAARTLGPYDPLFIVRRVHFWGLIITIFVTLLPLKSLYLALNIINTCNCFENALLDMTLIFGTPPQRPGSLVRSLKKSQIDHLVYKSHPPLLAWKFWKKSATYTWDNMVSRLRMLGDLSKPNSQTLYC